jgi:hypothetical protein
MSAFYQTKKTAPLMIFLGFLFIPWTMPDIVASAKDSLWFSVLLGLLVVLYAGWFVFRLARVGVHVNEEGIRVVNPIRTRAIPWSSIRSFSWGRYGFWPKVVAELNDGAVCPIFGLLVGGSGPSPSAEIVIDKLNGHLKQATDKGKP